MTLGELLADYICDYMTDQCEARNFAKSLQMYDGVAVCERVCCIGCQDRCGYYCSYADSTVRELKQYCDTKDGE